jgi:Asp-tRNA(Asn)/Glu-tRNA(Gln) amidotransferase C subunit
MASSPEMEHMKAMQRITASWLAQLPKHDYLMDTIGLVEEFSTDVTLVITSVEETKKLDMSDIEGDPFHDYLRQWKQIKEIVERILDNLETEPATKKRKQ